MTVYNGSKTVERAIKSVIHQSVPPSEIIVVNDASTDNTLAILEKLAKQYPFIKVLNMPPRIKPHRRTGMALNLAIKNVTQTFVAWMDADDVSFIHRFEKQLNWLLLHPEYVGCGSQIVWKDYRWYIPQRKSNLPLSHSKLLTSSIKQTPVFQQTAFFRSVFLQSNQLQYDETIEYAEDYEFFSRAIRIDKIANLPDSLVEYHLHPSQSIQQHETHLTSVANTIRKNLVHFTGQAPNLWLQILNHRTCQSWVELSNCIDGAAQELTAFKKSLTQPLEHVDEMWQFSLHQKVVSAIHRNPTWLNKLKVHYPYWHSQLGWKLHIKIRIKQLLGLT
jgi:glycosyltransferase involved in cell wall biosynthesis